MNDASEPRARRGSVSARLDPEVIQVVEQVAEAERRSISSLVRNVVEDWARQQQERATSA
jgi:predicted transcriptional regulator